MMDKDLELQGEAAERSQFKKLTAADIPIGFNFAAVDSDGRAFAYTEEPKISLCGGGWKDFISSNYPKFIGKDFDVKDWKNSLVKRETAERPNPKKLTAADIPEGFNYAAVDASGNTVAYYEQPFLAPGDFEWSCYTNDFKPIGVFDASDWQNSFVSRETAERPQLKKLTAADIPEGFNYAAVDASGNGFAYQGKPKQLNTLWVNNDEMDHVLIGLFDASDWRNSLVTRETAEKNNASLLSVSEFAQLVQEIQKNKKGANEAEAIKDQQDKPSFLEIDPNFLEAMAWRMTANKGKYPVNNWKGLTDRFTILDAIYRHANDIKRMLEGGESLTGETIQKHCAAIACNAQFLFYHSPENQWERAARSRQSNAKEI